MPLGGKALSLNGNDEGFRLDAQLGCAGIKTGMLQGMKESYRKGE